MFLSIPDSTQDDNYELSDEAQGFISPVEPALEIGARRENEVNEHLNKSLPVSSGAHTAEAVEKSDRVLRSRKLVTYAK